MKAAHIDDVVLVGGAPGPVGLALLQRFSFCLPNHPRSRMPKLRELLQEFFGQASKIRRSHRLGGRRFSLPRPTKRLHTEIDPDITVAWGAH